jgi:hypothetical protein
MNIVIGKFGRSVYFNKDKRSMTNGDEEAPMMYTMLAKKYPDYNFYLAGRSDLQLVRKKESTATLDIFFGEEESEKVPSNIIDLFDDWDSHIHELPHNWLWEKIERLGLKFDLGLIYYGPMPNVGITDKGILKLNGSGIAKSLDMFKLYYAPIMYTLNQSQIPWIGLCGDPKYVPSIARDMLNEPKVIMSQTKGKFKTKRIKSYDDSLTLNEVYENHSYAAIETIFMLNEKKTDWRNINKDILFTIGLNGGQSRDKFIRKWFIDKGRTDVKVYGKWSDEFTNKYPDMFEEKRISEVEDEFFRTKYTIIPPPHRPKGNFVTQKFWKMIMYGIIPFFHPGYDTEKILPVPNILRINSPEDMWKKIDYLEANPEEYQKVLNVLWKFFDKDDLFDGTFLHNQVKHYVKKYVGLEL